LVVAGVPPPPPPYSAQTPLLHSVLVSLFVVHASPFSIVPPPPASLPASPLLVLPDVPEVPEDVPSPCVPDVPDDVPDEPEELPDEPDELPPPGSSSLLHATISAAPPTSIVQRTTKLLFI
jgi:hypothetical protein